MLIYVNWEEKEILTEKKYKDFIQKEVEENHDAYCNFNDYLNELYYSEEIFNFSDEIKEQVLADYKEMVKPLIEEDWEDVVL